MTAEQIDLDHSELIFHLNLMIESVGKEITSLIDRIPKYQAEFEQDGYPEDEAMVRILGDRLTRRKVDLAALTASLRLVERQKA